MAANGLRGGAGGGGQLRAIESDAQIESSFRRLLASIEAERENIRSSWQHLQEDRDATAGELEQLRSDTEDWCTSEKAKIDAQWKQLDRLSESMADFWPKKFEIIKINCSGELYEIPRTTLCSLQGSYISELFSEENSKSIRADASGYYYLDINPHCFAILIEYLQNRRLRVDAPLPVVPKAQVKNMELLAEAWNLTPFLRENRVNPVHTTSLKIVGNVIEATHPGWQVISAQHPLPSAHPYAFEVRILSNPGAGSSGGLAVGVVGHIPTDTEIHSILLPDSVMYTSGNGLVGNGVDHAEAENVATGFHFKEGTVVGIRHDPLEHRLDWFCDGQPIGSCVIRAELLDERMKSLYPVFALYVPEQRLQVDFRSRVGQ